VNGASWQGRTAVALVAGAAGEGACVALAAYVAGGFVVATFAVAIALGWYFGPWIGAVGAGTPPLGIAFVSGGDDASFVSRLLTALAVVIMLGGTAWLTGRVRERYGKPPWGSSTGVSE
jgi:hypothetical protein